MLQSIFWVRAFFAACLIGAIIQIPGTILVGAAFNPSSPPYYSSLQCLCTLLRRFAQNDLSSRRSTIFCDTFGPRWGIRPIKLDFRMLMRYVVLWTLMSLLQVWNRRQNAEEKSSGGKRHENAHCALWNLWAHEARRGQSGRLFKKLPVMDRIGRIQGLKWMKVHSMFWKSLC